MSIWSPYQIILIKEIESIQRNYTKYLPELIFIKNKKQTIFDLVEVLVHVDARAGEVADLDRVDVHLDRQVVGDVVVRRAGETGRAGVPRLRRERRGVQAVVLPNVVRITVGDRVQDVETGERTRADEPAGVAPG